MLELPLREGERVRLCVVIPEPIPIGTPGTIIQVYPPDATIITVRFDGHTRLASLRAADVARLEMRPPEPAAPASPTHLARSPDRQTTPGLLF